MISSLSLSCLSLSVPAATVAPNTNYSKEISALERSLAGSTYPTQSDEERLKRLEEMVFGAEASTGTTKDKRIARLQKTLSIPKTEVSEDFKKVIEKEQRAEQEKEIASSSKQSNQVGSTSGRHASNSRHPATKVTVLPDMANLSEQMLKVINQERSFRSLSPLSMDPLAQKVANEHASYLVQTKQFSHYGSGGSNPDQRYTAAGGGGRVDELVDGFFAPVDKSGQIQPLEVSAETPNFLMDAFLKVPDKSDIVFNPDINKAGVSFVIGPDKKQLVVVIQMVVDAGSISSVQALASIADYIQLTGSLGRGYKFAWVGVSKKELDENEKNEVEPSPYFAPIDQVIYMDKDSDRAKNIAKAGGMILAMVAAPFTYGASMIVADILMQSVAQTYQAQDVEVRGGIRASDASFSGKIAMGEWGPGLYYLTVWGFPSRTKKPVILSRRAIKVVN
ncbi:MAG: CAP domain-containing protein [Candidatus Caenarcaniphilales bacterium]|nr:CAP domain-containing protein [Candidatus Caenarcaniphilales bacterium]